MTGCVMGFAAAVGMWFVGFLTHLPAVQAPAPLVGVLLSIVQIAAGFSVGRRAGRAHALPIAAIGGLVTSLINLLVIGSIIASPGKGEPNALQPGWPLMVGGTIVGGVVLAVIGALIGSRTKPDGCACMKGITSRDSLARFAVVAAFSVLPVLLSGGIVTSKQAGLAVPDWPNTYNAAMFLYPLADMTGGIYYEHAHRLFGSLAGLTVLTFFVLTLIYDRSPRSIVFGAVALAAVVAQGVLGGVRVTSATPTSAEELAATTDNSTSLLLACVHGITGQLTFALIVSIAAMMSRRWIAAASEPSERRDGTLRFFSAAGFVLILIQLALGAAARHFEHPAFIHSHAGFSLFVLIAVGLAAFRTIAKHKDEPVLRKLGHATLHSLILQVLLGVGALVVVLVNRTSDPPVEVIVTTAHQGIGALLLASVTLLMMWTRRLARA